MEIIDTTGIFNKMRDKALQCLHYECGAVGVAVKRDNAQIYEIEDAYMLPTRMTKATKTSMVFPATISVSLIKLCAANNKIPVMIHTHPINHDDINELLFSHKDLLFVDGLVMLAWKHDGINTVIFSITNGLKTIHRVNKKNCETVNYYYEG